MRIILCCETLTIIYKPWQAGCVCVSLSVAIRIGVVPMRAHSDPELVLHHRSYKFQQILSLMRYSTHCVHCVFRIVVCMIYK